MWGVNDVRGQYWYVTFIIVLFTLVPVLMFAQQRAANQPSMLGRAPSRPQVVPTTSNPTINLANGGVRTMQNTSFEQFGTCASPMTSWSTIRMERMFGWKTTQPLQIENCNAVSRWLISCN